MTGETRRPHYMTIITGAPWPDAVNMNWGRFMREFGIDKWEKV